MRRLTFSEEVRDGSNSSWEDLYFLKILLDYWPMCYQEGGTRLQVVAICYGSRTAFPHWLFTGSWVCTSCSKRYLMGMEQWLLKNQASHSEMGYLWWPLVHSFSIGPLATRKATFWSYHCSLKQVLTETNVSSTLNPYWRCTKKWC